MAESRRERTVLVYTGLVFALVNIVTAWALILLGGFRMSGQLQSIAAEAPSVAAKAEGADAAKPEQSDDALRALLLHELPGISRTVRGAYFTHHNMNLVALAVAFCFFGVGFSLVIMGKNAAIEARAERDDIGSLMIKTTSPGLFCFLLSATVTVFTLYRGGFLPSGMLGGGPSEPESTRALATAQADLIRAESDRVRSTTNPRVDFAADSLRLAEAEALRQRATAEAQWLQAKSRALDYLRVGALTTRDRLDALKYLAADAGETETSDKAAQDTVIPASSKVGDKQ